MCSYAVLSVFVVVFLFQFFLSSIPSDISSAIHLFIFLLLRLLSAISTNFYGCLENVAFIPELSQNTVLLMPS